MGPLTAGTSCRMRRGGGLPALVAGLALLGMPQAHGAESASPTTHAASCRDSRLPPRSKRPWEEEPHLRLEVDVNDDGLADVLEATDSLGSGFSSTNVQLTLGGSGVQLKAGEGFAFAAISALNPVPKELLDPRHRGALVWIEEALFDQICTLPDPSLAWLLDFTKRLTWIEGPPDLPGSYAMRLPARRVAALRDVAYVEDEIDPMGEVWLFYGGGVHGYPPAEKGPVELARRKDRVLLGTAHGVILTNPEQSRHAWLYVNPGDGGDILEGLPSSLSKLRFPGITGARIEGDTAVIRLKSWKRPSQVRVNLNTGAILK